MIKSKTKIEKRLIRKTNPEIIETIIETKKNKNWIKVSSLLSSSKKKFMNIGEIDKLTKEGDKVLFAGKILSEGSLNKKITIVAMNFSENAQKKILNSKGSFSKIIEELKINPEAKGLKILE